MQFLDKTNVLAALLFSLQLFLIICRTACFFEPGTGAQEGRIAPYAKMQSAYCQGYVERVLSS